MPRKRKVGKKEMKKKEITGKTINKEIRKEEKLQSEEKSGAIEIEDKEPEKIEEQKESLEKIGGKEIDKPEENAIAAGGLKPVNYEKQTKVIVAVMIILIASIFLAQWIVQQNKKFEYGGIKFYAESEGEILYYKSLLGYVTAEGNNIPFILKLRNDPRELGEIPIAGNITLRKEAILSLSPEIADCSNTYITIVDFSRTLKAFGINASAATTDKNYAKEHETVLADCKDAKKKTVIVMKEGNETKISRDGDCYTIEIKDCQVQESFERFLVGLIENAKLTAPINTA